ncbi:MAG: hypothetical protein MZV63_26770 [Marinilabiliales bacterium]|nr:hypothetical protein [Marinilabiliales bacterium]
MVKTSTNTYQSNLYVTGELAAVIIDIPRIDNPAPFHLSSDYPSELHLIADIYDSAPGNLY